MIVKNKLNYRREGWSFHEKNRHDGRDVLYYEVLDLVARHRELTVADKVHVLGICRAKIREGLKK